MSKPDILAQTQRFLDQHSPELGGTFRKTIGGLAYVECECSECGERFLAYAPQADRIDLCEQCEAHEWDWADEDRRFWEGE